MGQRIGLLNAAAIVCTLLLTLYVTFAYLYGFRILQTTFTAVQHDPSGIETTVGPHGTTMPYETIAGDRKTRHTFDIQITTGIRIPATLSLMVDECLEAISINNSPLNLSKMAFEELCGYGHYILIPTADKIRLGNNKINVKVFDPGEPLSQARNRLQLSVGNTWPGGMRVEIPMLLGFAVLSLLLVLRSPLGRQIADPAISGILTLGAVLYAYCLVAYPFKNFSDFYAHLEYILFLYHNAALPDPLMGFETFHPPTYYLLTLPFYFLGDIMGAGNPIEVVRCLGTLCYMVFLLYGIATIRLLVTWRPVIYIAALLLVLWPAGLAHAGKVNNDLLLFPLAAASIYYLIRWQQQGSAKDVWWACALALMTVAVKSSGLLLLAPVAAVVVFHAWVTKTSPKRLFPSWKAVCGLVIIAMLCIGINFGRVIHATYSSPKEHHFLITSTPQEKIDRNLEAFTQDPLAIYNMLFGFDLYHLVRTPFIKASHFPERLFWNLTHRLYLLNLEAAREPVLAGISLVLYLLMLTYALFASIFMFNATIRQQQEIRYWYWLAPAVGITVGMSAVMYLWASNYGNFDVRYIHYSVIWLVALFARNIEWYRNQDNARWLSHAGVGLGVMLVTVFLALMLKQTYLS